MAQIIITIPDDKVILVLEAFHSERGIEATPAAFKAEIVSEIKQTVKRYQVKEAAKIIPTVDVN